MITARLQSLAAYQMGGLFRKPSAFGSALDLIRASQPIVFPALSAMIRGVSFLPTLSCIGILGEVPVARSLWIFSVSPWIMASAREDSPEYPALFVVLMPVLYLG